MTDEGAAALIGGVGLLERAVNYTLGSLLLVTPELMSRPTPCRAWNLADLLAHMNDSMLALHEAADIGHVALDVPAAGGGDPVATLRDRACQLLGAWANSERSEASVGGLALHTSILTSTGALEIAAHGWDVASACGRPRPIPPALAEELLNLVPLFVTDIDRPGRFDPALAISQRAPGSDRLLAFLGRRP
ncbi:TIGR03086 family protein [Amycolatopsis sp. K13G38]|uniref:TIGR03086 family protein n=1 Tax=Amycolatopsis acididurans TaxID=2724524 RepID=A0ABX1JIX9_9PSEU|nr:TIGR03086 family metal-binding protein [Amycolatopsis acididurans]NKQ58591.1 TIGR03086 family protein [Amycolatopsis acididurans]